MVVYVKQVIAEQKDNRGSTATVVVNVLDVNDNRPIFDQDQYVVRVKESAKAADEIIMLTVCLKKRKTTLSNSQKKLNYLIRSSIGSS